MQIKNKTKEYKDKFNLMYSCQYRVAFCPKYKRKVFKDDIAKRLKEIFIDVSNEYDFTILEMYIKEDYVHLEIDCNPKFGIYNCITKLKRTSASLLTKEFPELESRLPNIWTRGAFISTAGDISLEPMLDYIDGQKYV